MYAYWPQTQSAMTAPNLPTCENVIILEDENEKKVYYKFVTGHLKTKYLTIHHTFIQHEQTEL